MNIQGKLKIDGFSGDGEDVISLNWGIYQAASRGLEQGDPRPSQLNIIIKSIQNSHSYFAWANSASDRKSGSIVFLGNEFAKGTPVVVKFTDAVCKGFSFSFNKNHSEGILFELQLSVPKVEYTNRVES